MISALNQSTTMNTSVVDDYPAKVLPADQPESDEIMSNDVVAGHDDESIYYRVGGSWPGSHFIPTQGSSVLSEEVHLPSLIEDQVTQEIRGRLGVNLGRGDIKNRLDSGCF